MASRTTITIEPGNLTFLNEVAGGNRSAYINDLIEQARKKRLAERMLKANREEAQDDAMHAELALWDATLGDGIEG